MPSVRFVTIAALQPTITHRENMSIATKPLATAGLVLAVIGLVACELTAERPRYPEISFAHLPPIRLDVARVDVVSEYASPAKPPNVEHLFPAPPASVAERWGRERVRAAGTDGTARVVIKRASVVEVPLKQSGGVRGALTIEQSERYDMDVEVAVEVERGGSTAMVSSRARRSRTVPEDISLNDRETVWFEMTEAVMNDLNASLEAEIREGMTQYLR